MAASVILGMSACAGESSVPSASWDVEPVTLLPPEREIRTSPDAFRAVSAFTADSAGTVYVADTPFKQIVAVSATGEVLWRRPVDVDAVLNSIGVGFGWLAFGDRGRRVVEVWEAEEGAPVRIHNWVGTSTAPFTNGQPLLVRSPAGDVALGLGDILNQPDPKYPALNGVQEYLAEFSAESEEPVGRLELPQRPGILLELPRATGGSWGYRPALVPRLVWTPNEDGGWTGGEGYEYEIQIVDSAGSETTLKRSVGPREPSPEAREAELRRFRLMGETYSAIRGREAAFLADTIGHFTTMAYSRDGTYLWVGRTYLEPNPIYDVWTADGAFGCSVQFDMDGMLGMIRRTPPVVVNGLLYHLAVESIEARDATIKVFRVQNICD